MARRKKRSIRFSDDEWQRAAERAARSDKKRSAFIRESALGLVGGAPIGAPVRADLRRARNKLGALLKVLDEVGCEAVHAADLWDVERRLIHAIDQLADGHDFPPSPYGSEEQSSNTSPGQIARAE